MVEGYLVDSRAPTRRMPVVKTNTDSKPTQRMEVVQPRCRRRLSFSKRFRR